MSSLYLINPVSRLQGYQVDHGYVQNPDLAILTIAAMAPRTWEVSVCEEVLSPVDLDTPARFVGLTGKTAQYTRMVELAREYRARGKIVLIGGPFASLDREAVRPHADILVTGEMEDIAPRLFADLEAGTWSDHYEGGRPDLRTSPVPRWDLYPVEQALTGALQTTRGCPFECEFCDVIQYLGRKQRHKDVGQVIAELDALHAAGFRETFLCDDNFTVHRRFARTMLDAMTEWNAAHADDPMRFFTQASLDVARDADLLRRCAEAGLRHLFIGIETINADSLRETGKKQNLLMPMLEALERIVSHGILVRAGVIVGFDHDGPGIFEELFEFFQSSPVTGMTVGTLTASKSTPLYDRLKREGRLREGIWEEFLDTNCNIVPKLMSHEHLVTETRKLAIRLFTADAFEQRALNMIRLFDDAPIVTMLSNARQGVRSRYVMSTLRRIATRGHAESRMLSTVMAAAVRKPMALRALIVSLTFFEQTRTYLDDLDRRVRVAA